LMSFATSERILNAEIDTIVAAIGDDEGAQQPHSFKSSSFSIPTQCGYCKTSIWGLSKQGKTCKLCGLSVHSKCEMKVPADCHKAELSRTSSMVSRKSTLTRPGGSSSFKASSTPSSFVKSVADESPEEESYPVARMLFDFSPTSEFELRISAGDSVQVLEPDDGSGWVKAADGQGNSGLVPASYLAYDSSLSSTKPSETGSGQRVRGIYDYEAQGSDELGLKAGEILTLTSGPNGGQNYGEGWWEGINSRGQKGIFPSNYVEVV